MRAIALSLMPALFIVCAPLAAQATTYTYVDLGDGPKGYIGDYYVDVNGVSSYFVGGDFIYSKGSCGKDCSFNIFHAAVWPKNGSSPIDITPQYYAMAWVEGGYGTLLAGIGETEVGGYYGYDHAGIWRGPNLKWRDINPAGDQTSGAFAVNGTDVVGYAYPPSTGQHATMWPLNDLVHPIDLHPGTAYIGSIAYAIFGNRQVGAALTNPPPPAAGTPHAMLWLGNAASAIDLTPANVSSAYAYGVSLEAEVGCGSVGGSATHALLWHNTAASMRDLNPSNFLSSCARAVRGGAQAGYGQTSTNYTHALVWSGTAASAVDLQLVLPSAYVDSKAYAFDAKGDILGSALFESTSGASWHAVMWIPQ